MSSTASPFPPRTGARPEALDSLYRYSVSQLHPSSIGGLRALAKTTLSCGGHQYGQLLCMSCTQTTVPCRYPASVAPVKSIRRHSAERRQMNTLRNCTSRPVRTFCESERVVGHPSSNRPLKYVHTITARTPEHMAFRNLMHLSMHAVQQEAVQNQAKQNLHNLVTTRAKLHAIVSYLHDTSSCR